MLAQATPPSAGSSSTAPQKTRNPDQKFVEEAAHGGMAEVEAGKLAQKQASNPSVKAFAEHMVTDHTKANDQLKQIAMTKGMTLPTDTDRSHKRDIEKLGKLQGADFDRDYMKAMVADHKKTVSLFEKEAKSGKDPELKQFAATLLPALQKHLQMAQSTEKELKKSSAAMK
jgi:putative membrane protein